MVPLFLKCQVEISPLSPRAPISVQELIIPNSLRWTLLANQLSWGSNTSLKGSLRKRKKAQRLFLPIIRQVQIPILGTKRPYKTPITTTPPLLYLSIRSPIFAWGKQLFVMALGQRVVSSYLTNIQANFSLNTANSYYRQARLRKSSAHGQNSWQKTIV